MSFIDIDYFKGALQIPNINKDPEGFEANYIDVYEPEILKKLLGYDLYKQLITNYDVNTVDEWYYLVNGNDYTVTISDIDYTLNWNGLINTEQISLIAYYVYYKYVKQNYQQLTGLGVINSNAENAAKVDPNEKLVWANNECSNLAGDYELPTTGENMTYLSTEPTLFNFIINHLDNYPNWIYKPINKINVLGI